MTAPIVEPQEKVHAADSSAHVICTELVGGNAIYRDLRVDRVSPDFLTRIPRDFARQHLVISQGSPSLVDDIVGTTPGEILAIAPTTSRWAVFNVGVRLGREVQPVTADPESIARIIDQAYGAMASASSGLDADVQVQFGASQIDRLIAEADRDLLNTDGKGPVIKIVDALIFEAVGRSASDVHVQPLHDRTLIRYRLDGVLHTVRDLPSHLATSLISRIKVMGRMDIAERRIPQDGRASVTIGPRSIDLRISGAFGKAKHELAKSGIGVIVSKIEVYRIEKNTWPSNDQGLALLSDGQAAPTASYYLGKDKLTDPWGRPYLYICPGPDGHPYEVITYGADGQPGGASGTEEADVSSVNLKGTSEK